MTQLINYHALNDFLDNQTDDVSSVYLWYERLSDYDVDGTESPQELETLFHAMKFLMSFSFTSAEELREVAEREAVQMAEKEEAWEEQKIALKEELDALRERITLSADAGDSSEAFRAQIDSLREENRELEKTNRDRDREMADLRDRFENLVSRADILTRERDALEQHRNQLEDTIRELQRRISSKTDESTKEWESRKLRQRNEQAVTLTRQMQAVVLQNEELREEVTRVGDALEEATRVINQSASRYAELTALHDTARHDLRLLTEENAMLREKLDASSSKLVAIESEAVDTEHIAAAHLKELEEANRDLRDELYATKRELDNLRQIADSINHEEKEAELEKLRAELMDATKTARSLYGAMTSKTSSTSDPTVPFRLRVMQLEKHMEQSEEKIASQKTAIEELEDALLRKDDVNSQLSAELERMTQMKFGDAREELKRLTTQLSFCDTQIAQLTNHCTLLQIELGQYADRILKSEEPHRLTQSAQSQETQTAAGDKPDVVPQYERPVTEERKRRKTPTPKVQPTADVESAPRRDQRELNLDTVEQQALLIASLYSELMIMIEEQEQQKKQMSEMESVLLESRRAMDDVKAHLRVAYEEIYNLKKKEISDSFEEQDDQRSSVELDELRRFASYIRAGGTELERSAEESTRKLIAEQIERLRLSRRNTVLRRRCGRAEHAMRRARERMVAVETQAGKRCAQLQYQLDSTLIELANCQSQLVRSVSIEKYEKLMLRFKKECIAEVLGSEVDEVWRDNITSVDIQNEVNAELKAKNVYQKKIIEVLSEQNDFWSKETEILQNENEELKRFVEEMENESDLKNILASIEQRLLETIREQQEGQRDYEKERRKANEAEEQLAKRRQEWAAERSRFVYSIRTLQSALSNAHLNTLNGLTLPQIEKLKAKIRDVKQNEMLVEETKNKIEALQNKLQQELALQDSKRKAKEAVDEENGDVLKLEQRMRSIYSSLGLQTIAAERLKNTLSTRDRQMSELKDELDDVHKENKELLTALASSTLFTKISSQAEKKPLNGSSGNAGQESGVTQSTVAAEDPSSWRESWRAEDSEDSSSESEHVAAKTILQDNSKDFERQLAKMKEAAELCIQGYKNQLRQKEEALKIFRDLVEEKFAVSSRLIIEKEIVREEVQVKDEETEERLRQSFGEVARLKDELEELEKINRSLYRKRRRSVVPTVSSVQCQTDEPMPEDVVDLKEEKEERRTLSRNPSESGTFVMDAEKKLESERMRHKNEIKQLQSKLSRLAANNKELLKTCEKIREDALAEMELKAPRIKEVDEQTMLRLRFDLEKTRRENKALRKTIEQQKLAVDKVKGEVQKQKDSELEISRWNERKKLEQNLSSTRKKLEVSVKRERELQERLDERGRLLEELRRDNELSRKELDRTHKALTQLRSEREREIRTTNEAAELKRRLSEESEQLRKKSQEVSELSTRLQSLQEEHTKLTDDYQLLRTELVQISSKMVEKAKSSGANGRLRREGSAAEAQHPQLKVVVATDETLLFQLRETKANMEWVSGLHILLKACSRNA
ncbi:hypothetical protein Q1695_009213 [Nippostrongylus brasiliensis]|nr:hypothetical protein Q1695_009213 [Nippostrongylus brasiliensis]